MSYFKLLTKYHKLRIENELLQDENVELKETLKEIMYREITINPGQNKRLKQQLAHSRSTIKNLRKKLKGGE